MVRHVVVQKMSRLHLLGLQTKYTIKCGVHQLALYNIRYTIYNTKQGEFLHIMFYVSHYMFHIMTYFVMYYRYVSLITVHMCMVWPCYCFVDGLS